ncbi:unnamed protein product, partial [Chrysoparadoxa australica]
MLNMYLDHYRQTAYQVDGASRRRFRRRTQGPRRKARGCQSNPLQVAEPDGLLKLLELLEQSCADAKRAAHVIGDKRHQTLAQKATVRLAEH